MTPLFRPRLLNSPFGDPALYVGLQGEGKALLLDIGDISRAAPGLLFKITEVFVSHTHIDHFIGIDHLLRLNLARKRVLHLYGPPGIIAGMTGKLRGYTWNLTQNYPFMLDVHEICSRHIKVRRFTCREKFKPGPEQRVPFNGTVVNHPGYCVKTQRLDHNGIVSLGFRLEEHFHININKDALEKLGLQVGPWLQTLKNNIRQGCPGTMMMEVPGRAAGTVRHMTLDEITGHAVHITPGEVLAYVSDCGGTPANKKKIMRLAAQANYFFCESAFLERDTEKALERGHLTARQAGQLARQCRATSFTPFHFSPRYEACPEEPAREAMEGFRGC
jgi:ribonuclease Z